jgi:hypothetical protein
MRTNSLIAGLALVLGAATFAAAGAPLTPDQGIKIMSTPGAWIEADGAILPDGTLMAKDVEIYAVRDPAELEEPAIYGAVAQINRAKSTMRVLGYLVTWDELTTIKDENKRQVLSSKIQDGMGVKIQGTLQPNGSFKATKIKVHAGKVKDGKFKAKEKILGPVTVVDGRAGMLRIMNTPIKLREDAVLAEAVVAPTP